MLFSRYNVPMNCPNDNTPMHQVQITANYGQPLFLDQCDCCGGIWFDESELYRARQGEADKVDLLDTYILTTVHSYRESGALLPQRWGKTDPLH